MKEKTYKILFVGNQNVGKTSLLNRYIDNYFPQNTLPTIGVDMMIKRIHLNDTIYKLQLWDLSGNERYKSIITAYFSKCDAIIFTYDITDKKTFEDLTNWIDDISEYNANFSNTIKILVGTKADLEDERRVEYEMAKRFAEKYEFLSAIECSSKKDINIDEVFENIMENESSESISEFVIEQNSEESNDETHHKNITKYECKCCVIC